MSADGPVAGKGRKKRGIQYAALCWRQAGGARQVLLITSRETRRWVIPKGWPMKDKAPWEAAAEEAYEEAGVRGEVEQAPVGTYRYLKRLSQWRERNVEVQVFRLEVRRELDNWPEQSQRERAWLAPEDAAGRVAEPDLAALIRALA